MIALFRLAFWRTAPLRLWIPLVALLGLCAWRSSASLSRSAELIDSGPPAAALVRQDVWALFGLLGAPLFLVRAASFARIWTRSDSEWLGSRPISRLRVVLVLLLGAWAGALALAAIAALFSELALPRETAGVRFVRTLETPSAVLVEGDPPLSWIQEDLRLDELASGARLILRPTVAPGSGPAVTVRVEVSSPAGVLAFAEERIHGPSAIELGLPTGAHGPASLSIGRAGPGAVLLVPGRSVDLVCASSSARLASLGIGLRVALALGAWTALAAGLGAWMRPGIASCLVVACLLQTWVLGGGRTFLPGGDLAVTWQLVGRGLVPPAPDLAVLAIDLVGALVGLALLHRGLRERRSS